MSAAPEILHLVITDNHSTYGPAMFTPPKGGQWPETRWQAAVVWDWYELADSIDTERLDSDSFEGGLDKVAEAHAVLWPDRTDDRETRSGDLWHVEGTAASLNLAWHQAYAAVLTEGPSGDDDTFDYWPSGLRALLTLSDFLDAHDDADGVTGTRRRRAEARAHEILDEQWHDEVLGKAGVAS